MSFKNSPFRYPHSLFAPAPGALYTLDEMADDLNSDKFLEACRHAPTNHLYRWLERPRRRQAAARACAPNDSATRSRSPRSPHARSRRTASRGRRRRSSAHTSKTACSSCRGRPARARATRSASPSSRARSRRATPARPFRVAVLARTHAAVNVALASVAKRTRELLQKSTRRESAEHDEEHAPLVNRQRRSRMKSTGLSSIVNATLAPLARLRVVKVCNDAGDAVPEGVGRVLPDGDEEASAAEQWESCSARSCSSSAARPAGSIVW